MVGVDLGILSFLTALGASHVVNLFLGWFIHFLQHRKILGIPLYQVHLRAHHEINENGMKIGNFLIMSLGHGLWSILLLGGFALYYLILPTWMTVTFIGNAMFLIAFTYYVHWEYDKPGSSLERFEWFNRGRALHRIHHSYFGEAFSKSKNYAFGGPFAGNLVDYLMGTFRGDDDLQGASYFPRPVRAVVGRIRQVPPNRPSQIREASGYPSG